MRGERTDVLIVGAGIAGLAAARTLRDWGADVEIVERAPAPTTVGTGIYLPGNAVRALGILGVGAQVADRAVHIERQRTADHLGRVLFDIDTAELWRGVGPCLAMHRADLHQALLTLVDDVPIRWGRTPRAMTADGSGVTVELSDGSTSRYDLVLGADGVHSTIRRLVFDGHDASAEGSTSAVTGPRPVGQYARRFVIPWPERAQEWSVRLGKGTAFLTIPIGDGRVYCYCDGPPADPVPTLRDLLSGYTEPIPTLLAALEAAGGDDAVQAGPIEEIALASWSRGAVLLVGDAAHATSPNMAQGAAMAVEDAIVLADCLTAADSIAAALRAFEARRRPRTDWVLAQTHRRDRARTLAPALRNMVLKRLGRRIFHANYRPLRDQP